MDIFFQGKNVRASQKMVLLISCNKTKLTLILLNLGFHMTQFNCLVHFKCTPQEVEGEEEISCSVVADIYKVDHLLSVQFFEIKFDFTLTAKFSF